MQQLAEKMLPCWLRQRVLVIHFGYLLTQVQCLLLVASILSLHLTTAPAAAVRCLAQLLTLQHCRVQLFGQLLDSVSGFLILISLLPHDGRLLLYLLHKYYRKGKKDNQYVMITESHSLQTLHCVWWENNMAWGSCPCQYQTCCYHNLNNHHWFSCIGNFSIICLSLL